MANLKTSSISEQVASHLREGIAQGRWKDLMPGRDRLAAELGVSPNSVQRGLEMLEREGLLVTQGGRRRRKIVLEAGLVNPPAMSIGILPFDPGNVRKAYVVDLKHRLMEAGHPVSVASKTLTQLGMKIPRLVREVQKYEVDAWVIVAAPPDVLEWFAARPIPVFAFYGGHLKLPMAGTGPDKRPAITTALNRLISLGHRRMVFLLRHEMRSPPCKGLQAFAEVLESHDIRIGPFNLPHWEESPEGFQRCLDSLFATTPPTALIIDESELFIAAQQHLARLGILAPEDVSLICTDPARAFTWCRPTISHLAWSPDPMVRRVVRWVENISHGKDDRRKTTVKAEFVEGGTIGQARE